MPSASGTHSPLSSYDFAADHRPELCPYPPPASAPALATSAIVQHHLMPCAALILLLGGVRRHQPWPHHCRGGDPDSSQDVTPTSSNGPPRSGWAGQITSGGIGVNKTSAHSL
uniref:Uncharacterized protein n=1 Tax=Eutreptiella gymnastica TaxID=73025 RepID=A0A7S1JEC3_9EUGL|mmetsp:Transcript_90146/g.156087  ORF Transcript_90146/g.156087 Transcript_90146/m.156087 type:complete len:113 (+) Transcript_90146:13-351(+)